MTSVEAAYCSGWVCTSLEEGQKKLLLFLQAGLLDRAVQQVHRMNQEAAYLRANFSPAALARGPISR